MLRHIPVPGCALTARVSKSTFGKRFGLHPDGFEAADSGWPRVLKSFDAEAWRRADAGELADEKLYCCDAQWCGLYDRMFPHTADEMEWRLALAADFGEAA
jgi:hypothetical protein